MVIIKKKKKENPKWKKEKREGLSSASISINPLLKIEAAYPFNFVASNSLRKKSTANDNINKQGSYNLSGATQIKPSHRNCKPSKPSSFQH